MVRRSSLPSYDTRTGDVDLNDAEARGERMCSAVDIAVVYGVIVAAVCEGSKRVEATA